jgi:hypothetical protein
MLDGLPPFQSLFHPLAEEGSAGSQAHQKGDHDTVCAPLKTSLGRATCCPAEAGTSWT